MQTPAVDSDVRTIMREVTDNLTRNLREGSCRRTGKTAYRIPDARPA